MSNTSLADFIKAASIAMHADRPDIWPTLEEASECITTAFSDAAGMDDGEEAIYHIMGYTLTKSVGLYGLIDYTLSKKLVSFAVDEDGDSDTLDWTVHSKLYSGVDMKLPPPEELDIEPDIMNDIIYEEEDDDDSNEDPEQ
jgi:hypothetical protein